MTSGKFADRCYNWIFKADHNSIYFLERSALTSMPGGPRGPLSPIAPTSPGGPLCPGVPAGPSLPAGP